MISVAGKYHLPVKTTRHHLYDRLALFLVLINCMAFILLAIYTPDRQVRIGSLVGTVIIGIALGIHFFLARTRQNEGTPYIYGSLFLVMLMWLNAGFYWFAVINFIITQLYIISKRKVSVDVSHDRIVYTSFPQKTMPWSELSNVILKDDLLTIDRRDNRIIQVEIDNGPGEVNEKEFNEFCRERLRPAIIPA